MSQETPLLTVVGGTGANSSTSSLVSSPGIPPIIGLDTSERRIWKYICDSLVAAGIEHVTAGLPIAIVVRTYKDWIEAAAECEKNGRYQESKNGWSSESPWAADERRLKSELGQWLPKACLTIPSLTRVKREMGVGQGQDDLFADLVGHAQSKPQHSQS